MPNGFEIQGINHVFMSSRDLPGSMKFWRDTLGLHPFDDCGAALGLGDAHLFLGDHGKDGEDAEFGFPVQPGRPYLFVKVKGLDALARTLKEKGCKILAGPMDAHWGPRLLTAQDPDGNPVVFIES